VCVYARRRHICARRRGRHIYLRCRHICARRWGRYIYENALELSVVAGVRNITLPSIPSVSTAPSRPGGVNTPPIFPTTVAGPSSVPAPAGSVLHRELESDEDTAKVNTVTLISDNDGE